MPDRQRLRVVHTSDVHLGAHGAHTDLSRTKRDRMHDGFRAVVDLALAEDADALLIAGDFFDNDDADHVVEFATSEIRRFGRPTLLVPGNHDPMDPGALYWRHDFEALAPNLSIIRDPEGEIIEVDGLDLVAWGRAYLTSDHFEFRPLGGLPARLDRRWHIALAHGHYFPAGERVDRNLPIHEVEVAAAAAGWDYLAFGHFEAHRDVSAGGATAVYSGAPVPLSDFTTLAGWAVVVDFDEAGVRWRAHAVDPKRRQQESAAHG